jgi:hypothetical protein
MKISLWSELWQWLKALIRHWIAIAGCALFAVFQICYSIWHHDWLPVLSWGILGVSFVWATFLSWRDEHLKTIGIDRCAILQRAVEIVHDSPRNVDPTGAMLELADALEAKKI